MKVIRSYQIVRDVLYCNVDFVSDFADFEDDRHFSDPAYQNVKLSCIVGPSARRMDDFKVSSMNCPRQVVLDETIRFCQTLKQMYQL